MRSFRPWMAVTGAALIAALAVAPVPAQAQDGQETTPEGVVLPDEERGEERGGGGGDPPAEREEPAPESSGDDEAASAPNRKAASRSAQDRDLPTTGWFVLPAALLGVALLSSGVALRRRTRRRRRTW